MRKTILVAVVACLLVGAAALMSTAVPQGKAETERDWSQLQIVTYASGLTGFFDPDTGKLYLYDSKLDKCFIIHQLTKLGEPMEKLKN